jgi:hypothetical protein
VVNIKREERKRCGEGNSRKRIGGGEGEGPPKTKGERKGE